MTEQEMSTCVQVLGDAPQCLRIVKSSSVSLRIAWDPNYQCSIPDGGYELELTNQQTGECLLHHVGHELWMEVYGLASGCSYSARARAICQARPGDWSYPALECATPSAPFPAPHPISILGATTNSATITWPECHPPYETLEFEVQLRILSDGFSDSGLDLPTSSQGFSEPDWRTVWVGTSNTVRITHLESGCTYAGRLRTKCDQGHGDWSCSFEVGSLRTQPSAPVITAVQGQVNAQGHINARVVWQPSVCDGGQPILSYKVCLVPVMTTGFVPEDAEPPTGRGAPQVRSLWTKNVSEGDASESLDLFVHRLPPSKLGYCMWVRARNSNGASHWSRRFIFHSPAQHSTAAPPTVDFKANPFSAPFVSRCFSHRRNQSQAGGAEVGYSQRSRACAATKSLSQTGKSGAFMGGEKSQPGALLSLTEDGWVLNTAEQVAEAEDGLAAALASTSISGSNDDDAACLSTYHATSKSGGAIQESDTGACYSHGLDF